LETDADLSKECSETAKTTEVNNSSPRVERCARTGTFKPHISTPILLQGDQREDLLITSAEIQVIIELFGVIPLMKRRDGKNVPQGPNVLL
jgi:hypothetical protein